MAWYTIRHGKVWHGMWKYLCDFHVLWHCLRQWSRSHVEKTMSVGGHVHTNRTRSQVEGPLHACSVHIYSSYSLWAVTVHWDIVNIYISLFWDRTLGSHSYYVLSVDQAFYESVYLYYHSVQNQNQNLLFHSNFCSFPCSILIVFHSMLKPFSSFCFLLLPIYWYALSFVDFHQWSARLKI